MPDTWTLYALIDENAWDTGDERTLVLDGVEAGSFSRAGRTLFANEALWEPETWLIALDSPVTFPALANVTAHAFGEGVWYRVTFQRTALADANGALYPLQASPDTPRERVKVTQVEVLNDIRIRNKLERFARLQGGPRATKAEVKALLDAAGADIAEPMLVVYDVGQGNCNALVDAGACPGSPPKVHLFFDFGVPTGWKYSTLPTPALDPLSCPPATLPPPVVLSHWDMDHWAAAVGGGPHYGRTGAVIHWDSRAIADRKWLVPSRGRGGLGQRLTPTAWRLALALHRHGNLMIWPTLMNSVRSAAGHWIIKCVPQPGVKWNNNNTGLALSALLCSRYGDHALCPGDAEYSSILTNASQPMEIFHLVASHHGANLIHAHAIPDAYYSGMSTLAFSHGAQYGHPKAGAISDHLSHGWNIQHETHNRRALAGFTHGTVGLSYWQRKVTHKMCSGCASRIATCPVWV